MTQIDITPYDMFKITGTRRDGKRNPPRQNVSIRYLQGFNYWTKTMWGRESATGKWRVLYRVAN
jgi:hypothetical protein